MFARTTAARIATAAGTIGVGAAIALGAATMSATPAMAGPAVADYDTDSCGGNASYVNDCATSSEGAQSWGCNYVYGTWWESGYASDGSGGWRPGYSGVWHIEYGYGCV